ncbi:hypothetical protein A3D42_00510 [Candidatus Nomurabacteria bacterium RIFCSPHIGHO2_02_FULL_41_18]|uniref:ABC transporter substrate-binding protein n=1 Tax=Candidatus Nomurabacteria bacterium RIFCSPHIGHO2_02_FULL_41_18 TaxID=1801754 RepID=A0A1F6W7X7_9BACT|nr:MAG: hypothetical protein A2737_02585 [Candidatus Nomurabacteria bacterium RIFCSPHIGHO2_01_FULL_41_71]OGI77902.1 MAG: hypothetical protein A3D42_00510 [Candidatus Nomurabacteria bacterium RIFCSPHIGHO2_02_FULL_41_18]OGI90076.1 MAG: hypothetical protein A3B01_00930 [Candidatus Nomurabacteria bacterium RIFCSPLOWO2_01_FULL_41_52b]
MKNFQIILIAVFIIAAVLGLLVFSGAIPIGEDNQENPAGNLIIWGTFKAEVVNPLLDEFDNANPDLTLSYVEKNPKTFDSDLLEALASGVGPDIFFLPDNLAFHYGNKILVIPYQNYPISSFKKNFAAAGEVFLVSNGILAFPITIDPMVMYYNRSMLDAKGIVYPPSDWDQFVNMAPSLTERSEAGKIIKSAVALGHSSNVFHAKDILSMLFMQTGAKMAIEKEGRLVSDLGLSAGAGYYSPESALIFYTDFADPGKSIYSWNKSFPLSRDYFSTDNLAFYFGYASELSGLINRNPNQNFSVTEVPQIKGSSFKLTSARVTGLAVSAFSKNQNTAFLVASALTGGNFAAGLAANSGVAPARRDLLASKPEDSFSPTFYASALYGRSWLDPSPEDTDDIFRRMIEGVLSGAMRSREAVVDANSKLNLLFTR